MVVKKIYVKMIRIILLLVAFASSEAKLFGFDNNACKNWSDYFTVNISPNCWYEPDVRATTKERIKRHFGVNGYETHEVQTKDGYILLMFRILRENPKGVVVLQHPISSDGSIWMDQGNASTAITFWEQGYEVWIPNHRGTWYSEGHVNLTINDYNYWNWTFHEIGIYDYAAFFEKISEVTHSNDLIFVGHSMAGSSSLAYASLYPEHAQKYLKMLILMGPVSYMKYVRSPLKDFSPAVDMLRAFTKRLGIGGICTKDSTCIKLITWASNLPIKDLVVAIIMVFTGWTPGEFDPPLYYYMTTGLKGTGLGVYYHYAQIVNAGGKYQMWDYGEQGNLIAYNSTTPPEYPVENINVPVYLVTSSSDSCGTVGDSQILYSKLPKTTRAYGKFETTGLNHIDVHWGKDRNKVYDRIFNLINKIL